MYDDFGFVIKFLFYYYKKLIKLGFKVVCFNLMKLYVNFVMNFRDYRKIVVIDNKVVFIGGFNIGDEYINKKKVFGYWNDVGIMIEGEVVWSMIMFFLENWLFFKKDDKIDFLKYNIKYLLIINDVIYILFGDILVDNNLIVKNIYLYLINDV